MDAGDAAMLAGEIRHVLKRYGVQAEHKVPVRFVSKDFATLEITFDPSQGALNSMFEPSPRGSG